MYKCKITIGNLKVCCHENHSLFKLLITYDSSPSVISSNDAPFTNNTDNVNTYIFLSSIQIHSELSMSKLIFLSFITNHCKSFILGKIRNYFIFIFTRKDGWNLNFSFKELTNKNGKENTIWLNFPIHQILVWFHSTFFNYQRT